MFRNWKLKINRNAGISQGKSNFILKDGKNHFSKFGVVSLHSQNRLATMKLEIQNLLELLKFSLVAPLTNGKTGAWLKSSVHSYKFCFGEGALISWMLGVLKVS